MVNKRVKTVMIVAVTILFVLIYFVFDPSQYAFFPRCPLNKYLGILCPGCGSQRALHDLFNLNIASSFQHNPLMITAIPYIIGGYYFETRKSWSPRQRKIRNFFYGVKAIWIVFGLIILYWVGRNMW